MWQAEKYVSCLLYRIRVAGTERAGVSAPGSRYISCPVLLHPHTNGRVSEAVIIKLFTPFGKVVREQFCYHMVGPRRGEPRG